MHNECPPEKIDDAARMMPGTVGSSYNRGISKAIADNSNNPSYYLDKAFSPSVKAILSDSHYKARWTENGYNYQVRIHPANNNYTQASSIYRIARQEIVTDGGKGTGWSYLGSNNVWYPESVLKEFFKGGVPNPTFDVNGAMLTHIKYS